VKQTLAVTTAATLAVAAAAAAQEGPVLLSVDANLADYGLESLDSVRLGRVALVHAPGGDRVALHFLRASLPGDAPAGAPASPTPLEGGSDRRPAVRALWVWNTAEILADERERASFLEFVTVCSIERVFLYVPAAEGESPSAGFLPFDGDALAPLLASLHEVGAETYALDGDPAYVRLENHGGVVRTVRRVIEHNRTHRAEERFYGVRYDIEPYILAGFQGPHRLQILTDYVRLLESVARVAHEGDLRVGADVPFWLDAVDEITGEPFQALVDGAPVPVLPQIMRAVDDVGVMAYRTTADGPAGVVLNASTEIALANEGPAEVYVGVETTRIDDEELYMLRGRGRAGVPPLADARWVVAQSLGGVRVRVWLVEGQEALDRLASEAGDPETLRYWFAGQPVPVPGDRISFHSLGADAMWSVTGEVERRFDDQPGFLGLAFHDYVGLRELLSR
jgi:hypothetical protein